METVRKAECWKLSDSWIALALALGTVLSRVPFQAKLLDSFDAINYALALEHFDVRLSQPQAPGYPLYILLGRVFFWILHDHRAALVGLSIVFSGLAVVAVYLAGREMYGRRVGWLAALLVATSTLFWFMGEIAAPYAVDLFASAMLGWLCYRMLTSNGRGLVWVSAVALGLVGAFRVQTLAFLFPLFLYALHRRATAVTVGALVVAGSIFGAFFVPSVMASGGLVKFIQAMTGILPIFASTENLIRSTRLIRFEYNAKAILQYTFVALGELGWPFAVIGFLSHSNRPRFWHDDRVRFLATWVLPTWVFYFLIWPGNLGTVLVCMPPFFLLAGVGLDWLVVQPRWKWLGWTSLAIVLIWQVVVFTVLPSRPWGEAYRRFDNRQRLEQITEDYATKLALLNETPVEGTVVYASDFRHPQYYAPQYRIFSPPSWYQGKSAPVKGVVSIEQGKLESWRDVDADTLVPPNTRQIVLFDLPVETIVGDRSLVEEKMRNGHTIQVISLSPDRHAVWTPKGLLLTNLAQESKTN